MTNHLPLVPRENTVSELTPVIPLDFVHPGLSMAQLRAILWAYRKLSLLIVVLVLSLTTVVMSLWPRTYTATVALMVNYEVNDPLNGKELPIGQVASYIATQVELMQTPELLLSVIDRLHLTQNPEYTQGYRGENGTLSDWVAAKLAKTLAIYQSQRGSQLIYINYSASDPQEAAQVANTVADVYKAQDEMRSTGPPSERAKRYAQQLSELKTKVDQAQKEVTAFNVRNGLIEEGAKTNTDVMLIATLDERLLAAQNARQAAEARASQNQAVSDQVLASNQTQQLKAQLAAQELRLAQLNRLYTPQYPDVQDAQLQVEASRRALDAALQSYTANASAGVNVTQRVENSLQRTLGQQRSKVLAKGQRQDEAAKYLLELESAQSVYKRALEGYDQIMFASGRHYSNVSLVSRATPPVKASKPRVLAGYVLGGAAALFLGLLIPLGYELLNRRVRCRDDLERQHGVPVLAEFGRLSLRMTT